MQMQRQLTWLSRHTSRKNSPLLSLTTVAVSPAALDPLPEVYTEMGAYRATTHLSTKIATPYSATEFYIMRCCMAVAAGASRQLLC